MNVLDRETDDRQTDDRRSDNIYPNYSVVMFG